MAIKPKKMKFIPVKVKIPQPNYDAMSRQVEERNNGKEPEDHIDVSYLASEIIMHMTQPKSIN